MIVSGPSGAGKGTVVSELVKDESYSLSISATTRNPRNYEKDGVVINVSASFGIAVAPDHGVTYEELSQKADEMLLAVKRENKKGYRLYQQISADKEL